MEHIHRRVQVEDVQCDLSARMTAMQQALLAILNKLLKQVQRTNKLDSSELTLQHAFSRHFDAAVKQQLAPIWNTLTHSTHVAVRDMRTVQELLQFLLRFNAVSFLRYLQCLRAAAGPTTEWMMLSEANTVFQVCMLPHCASYLHND